jgi:hypothetical protein
LHPLRVLVPTVYFVCRSRAGRIASMADALQHWTEVRNIVLTNRKHRRGSFFVSCPADAAFYINRIAANLRARDTHLMPNILVSLERGEAQLPAHYASHPALLIQPGETLKGLVELGPTVELGRTRLLVQIIISGVKMYRTANASQPGRRN